MKYKQLEGLVSQPRLERYLIACEGSKVRAQKLYKANLRVAEAFYPILNLFEVILRNQIDRKLCDYFNDKDWIIKEKKGFMNHQSLKKSRFYLRNQIQKTERKLRRKKTKVVVGKVIAEQPLGFWTSFFEPHHYKLIKGTIIGCFPHKPAAINRSAIHIKLQQIREFRNRVYHNEPICFEQNHISFEEAKAVKMEMYNILSWMGNNAPQYVDSFDHIDQKISWAEKI